MAGEEITYESLVNRWRREVTTGPTELTRIDPAFYQKVESYLRDLQEDYQRENKINPTSGKAMLLRDELFNMRKALEDIYDQRERKVVLSSLAAARGSNPDKTNMTEGERELFEDLVRSIKEGRRSILRRHDRDLEIDAPKARPVPELDVDTPEASLTEYDGAEPTGSEAEPLATPEGPATEPVTAESAEKVEVGEAADDPVPAPDPAAPTDAGTVAAAEGSQDEPDPLEDPPDDPEPRTEQDDATGSKDEDGLASGRVVVRVLEEVPEFTASDLRTYRLRAEDVAALPPSAARALVDHGKARLVAGALE